MATLDRDKQKIAIIGGGPAGLFMYKRLVQGNFTNLEIAVYERKEMLGAGMPYSKEGANDEHVTNVSDSELPELVTSMETWLKEAPQQLIEKFGIVPEQFNENKVVPRLLFGQYLSAQFELLQQVAAKKGIVTHIYNNCSVTDVEDLPILKKVSVVTAAESTQFDAVVICTGHSWPETHEGTIQGYFDSPYPPAKLDNPWPHPVAIRGSSLTAFDALRTMSRANGAYHKNDEGSLSYTLHKGSQQFRLVMHSIDGLLPAIRIHVSETPLWEEPALSAEDLRQHQLDNDGFISLDFLFKKNFKETFKEKDPPFYEKIKDLQLEEFVELMMSLRERLDPFTLFKAEYAEAEKSIRRQQSVAWKEMLAVLSFSINYPAKHLSAEDMLRLKKVLMPLISIVIAFVPQSSAQELMALYNAGVLELIPVNRDSKVKAQAGGGIIYEYENEEGEPISKTYPVFVDCIGQPQLPFEQFPFASLRENGSISKASVRFKDASVGAQLLADGEKKVERDGSNNYYLQVPGLAINDNFQLLDQYGSLNERIYIMAVPYIGGLNPDYSGLDFCEAASQKIMTALLQLQPTELA